ncbi:MAG: alpha-glucan family phosphorylase [Actinobacteria bacterium]|nr:alpha-glucan family phosphorylase [Actinomycetota bacterium]
MRALRSFTVRPSLPPALAPLRALAMNLRWAWDDQTREVFRWVDPDAWDATHHDPVRLLATVGPARLDELARDKAFLRFLDQAHAELDRYLSGEQWFQGRTGSPLRSVAYFSPEFGIAEALPQYSGGLGVLAGDHLKAASDLGVPLVGIGLFYAHGYFRQAQSTDGWQEERYPDLDPWAMALSACEGLRIAVEMGDAVLNARVWRADVGRVPLYLLDADVDDNPPELRRVTDRLYGGDTEHRLRQEILLGIGGVRALRALGIDADVFHTNEGHAGFLGLERMRELITGDGLTIREAIEAVRGGSLFTTHTPVPAGIDRFPRPLMERYFAGWARDCGVPFDDLMALGHRPGDTADTPFNMAVMGLRLAGRSNAVSKLHGAVSRRMFDDLWSGIPIDEVPITSVTNGVHAPTWVSAEMSDLLSSRVLPDWPEAGHDRWARVDDIGDDELWRVLDEGRARLVAFVRERLRESMLARGVSVSDAVWADEVLDPRALTICFARRFATYKRANLLLSQPERLRKLLTSSRRPVQFVFAGKAHPADEAGKELIRQVVAFSRDPEVRRRFVFVEDYDIAVARALYSGADVWLNTPRRPLEACGTSGMKAALNGALNCSILDGWWDELFDGGNGWAISSAERVDEESRRDEIEANSLFELLEHQIVPLFFDRYGGGVPRRWTARVRHSLRTIGPEVLATRMVRDYTVQLYEPTAAEGARLANDGWGPARQLAEWKARVRGAWSGVQVGAVTTDAGEVPLGAARTVSAEVHLGDLAPADVEVQLLHGPVGAEGELDGFTVATMEAGPDGRWQGSFRCDRPGRYGFTVRVVPHHPDLVRPLELGLVRTA